ncbi:hypothetical protein [Halapricum desulfuricans]|uniref:Protein similar to exonuclease RecJ central domain predicted to be involved in DNA replication initiation n=1 Tax=Halapricum desulfuricans TaxID=2841257 RepID=A0A897N220_9EURY|nr:hypothetical protein [Halapricum desulfuricans]QSG08440.1 Protein similar to exonuclease RecJ central domain predicted to be involved in DNA replication initiation [Halapricum desulfuricans]
MSTAGRSPEHAPEASDLADGLATAEFVRLVAGADADSLAAAGVLARALDGIATPYQVSVARPWASADRTTESDLTVAVGPTGIDGDLSVSGVETAASATAFETARELDADSADPGLALAGTRMADAPAATDLAEIAGLERRPGVTVPTDELADGLAHTTLTHAPFSGDSEAAAEALETIDDGADDRERRVASLLALSVLEDSPDRAAETIGAALRPYDGGPFETIGGYADVLEGAVREDPGTAVALALGHDVREAALDAWRRHARSAHAAIEAATTGRYDGLFVARDDGDVPVETVARLLRDVRSPEPVVLALTDGRAAAAATPEAAVDLAGVFDRAVDRLGDGTAFGTPRRAVATVGAETADVITAVREAIQS